MVLACGFRAHARLSTVSLPFFPLPSLFHVSFSNWGQGWRELAFFSGPCDTSTTHHLDFFPFYRFVFMPASTRRMEGRGVFDSLVLFILTASTLNFRCCRSEKLWVVHVPEQQPQIDVEMTFSSWQSVI